MNIPMFSIFSAISEIFVTIGLLYAILTGVRTGAIPKWLMGGVLLFELCVNVAYMTNRAAAADQSTELSSGMKLFYAAHGTLSLVLFVVLCVIYLLSLYGESKDQKTWFYRHPVGSWTLVFFWMISMLTGEAIFVMRYLLA